MDLAVQACQSDPSLSIDDALLQGGFEIEIPESNVNGGDEGTSTRVWKKKKRLELIRRLRKLGCTNPGVTENRGRRGRPAGSKDTVPRKARTCPQCHQAECPNSKPGPKRYTCVLTTTLDVTLENSLPLDEPTHMHNNTMENSTILM